MAIVGIILRNVHMLFTGGLLFNRTFLRKHGRFMLFLFVLCLCYITNDIALGLELKKTRELEKQLLRSKTRYNKEFSALLKFKRHPYIFEQIEKRKLKLIDSDEPPKIIER
jgi:hypothetical protein